MIKQRNRGEAMMIRQMKDIPIFAKNIINLTKIKQKIFSRMK